MDKKIETVEYGPGDVTYIPKKKYKLYEPKSPIIEIWCDEVDKLKNKIDKRTWTSSAVALNLGVILANVLTVNNFALNCVTIFSSSFLTAYIARTIQLMKKKNAFTKAIFEYDNLKIYEDMFPDEEKITNNVDLKGINEKKIAKRVEKIYKW